MRTIAAFLLAAFLGFAFHPARAVDVAAIRTTDGLSADWRNVIGANQSATAGWAFRVGAEAVQVQALGMYDAANGMKDAHPIGLWSASGTLLAQATLPAGTASLRVGSYRYVAITPITLNPGQVYVIGAYFGPVADQCGSACGDVMLYRGNETYDMRISFVQSRQTLSIAGAGPLAYPGVFAGVDEGFFGPNFLLSADLTPDPFAFPAQTDVAPGAVATSSPVTVSGINNPTAISVTGGTYAINAGAYTAAAGTVLPGDTVTVRLTAPPTFATTATARLTIGGVSADFVVTTVAEDSTPDPFAFAAQTGAVPGSVATSKAIVVTGTNSPSVISVTGGRYSVNGAAYTTATATVSPNDSVTLQLTAAPTFATATTATLTIGGVSADFIVTTAAADTVPNPFAFAPQSGVAPATLVTSNAITVGGIDSASPISIAGGAYSINGAAYTSAAGTVQNGDTVSVQLMSSASFATPVQATLTIGGVSADFIVTTAAADIVPDPFAFAPQSGVAPATPVTSNAITVGGIDSASPISITGGAYSINGAAYTSAAGTVQNGDTVSVQLMSSASFATQTRATLTIGGVSGTFDVVTRGAPPAQPVPLLGPGATALLMALLALVSLFAMRRTHA
ncbi:DUF4082 domain-containing protein [Tahibacter caeni]|uniref:DUF4082 domain-containing protein n=1 Tax=Tahibacter caeni TaxID=1453545 RepID=UPI002147AF16|nr:DUF4082 domain-containing protein [Tahibacter caeni]